MDNQIIIDGVDVSECLFYQSNFEEDYDVKIKHFCSNWHNSCESVNNSNCYFKQLARKTQECEELLKENQQLRNSLSDSLMFKFTGQENETNRYLKALEEIEEYINSQGINNKWNMRIQRFRLGILDIINKAKDGN